MTKDEIKKALECCSSDVESCAKCPYDFACTRYLCKDALNLIAEQEKEIERLKAKNKVLGDGVVKAFTNGFNTGREQVEKDIRRAKIDVLNEVKARCSVTFVGNRIISAVDIDKIIEEVENDK